MPRGGKRREPHLVRVGELLEDADEDDVVVLQGRRLVSRQLWDMLPGQRRRAPRPSRRPSEGTERLLTGCDSRALMRSCPTGMAAVELMCWCC